MHKTTFLSAGSKVIALLVGVFAWLSPDSPYFPSPTVGFALIGVGLFLMLAWALATGFRRELPRQPLARHLAAIAPLFAALLALFLAGRGMLPYPILPLALIIVLTLASNWVTYHVGGEPMSAAGEFGIAFLAIIALLFLLPVLGLATAGQGIWQITDFDRTPTEARIRATDVLDRYRPMPVLGYTADVAGMSLAVIAATGTPAQEVRLLPLAGVDERPWIPDSGPFHGWRADSVMRYALHGLTGPERAWLKGIEAHPGKTLIDSVSYAAELDPWAALKLPLPADLGVSGLPVLRVLSIRNAARARLFSAVLLATSNHHAEADSLIKSVIGFGLRLRDDSDLLIESLVGATIAREAGLTLVEHWRGEGNIVMADSLLTALGHTERFKTDSITPAQRSPAVIRATLIDSAKAGKMGRALRWEQLELLGVAPCTDLRELLYGPVSAIRETFEAAAPSFHRSPQRQAVFEVLQRGILVEDMDHPLPLIMRPAAWVLGDNGRKCGVMMAWGE